MKVDCFGNRNTIIDLLNRVSRPGVDALVDCMDASGFFEAPCSTKYHLCVTGGLAQHSLNVYRAMKHLADSFCTEDNKPRDDSIILCALLHDLGKMGDHFKENYVVNMIKDGKPTKAEPEQKYKQSEAEPFKNNPDLAYIPHEVRSVFLAERYIQLNEDEEHAIYYHNGKYTHIGNDLKETPLQMLLHFADLWCSRVVEIEEAIENVRL